MSDGNVADMKVDLVQIINLLEECQTDFGGAKTALEEASVQIRTAVEGSNRSDGSDAVAALTRAARDAEIVASEVASAIKEADTYKNTI